MSIVTDYLRSEFDYSHDDPAFFEPSHEFDCSEFSNHANYGNDFVITVPKDKYPAFSKFINEISEFDLTFPSTLTASDLPPCFAIFARLRKPVDFDKFESYCVTRGAIDTCPCFYALDFFKEVYFND